MPLDYPFAYLITYDLKQPLTSYGKLFEELQKSERWWHYLTSTWLVMRRDSLIELGPKLVPLVFQGDGLLIMPAKGPAMGWLPKEAWDWIAANVPKEW